MSLPALSLGLALTLAAAAPAAEEESLIPLPAGLSFHPVFVSDVDVRALSSEFEGEGGFALSRLILGARLGFGHGFQALGTIEWARDKAEPVDALVAYTPSADVSITAGFARTPLFPSARDAYVETLPVPELALPVRALWPGRDLGVEVHWTPTNAPFEAWLRVGNGVRNPIANDNNALGFDVRADGRFGAERGADAPWGLRFGAGLHLDDAFDRAGISGTMPGGYAFYRPVPVNGWRGVAEAHVRGSYGRTRLSLEAGGALESRSRDTDGNPNTPREALDPIRSYGAALELSHVLIGPARIGSALPSASGEGALEIAGRAEWMRLEVGASDVIPGTAIGGSLALRYWVTSFLGVSAAGYLIGHDPAPLEQPNAETSWLVLARVTLSVR